MRCHHRERLALTPRAARATDAVDVIFRMDRHIEIEHMAHFRNVEPTRGNVRRDQIGDVIIAETFQRHHARTLVHVAMQCPHIEAMLLERCFECRNGRLAVGEHNAVLHIRLRTQQRAQRIALGFRVGRHLHQTLRDGGSGRGGPFGFNPHRIGQELRSNPLDFRRHGGREEQRLAREGQELADALNIGNEPHVEHAVGFVHHKNLDAGEQQLAALHMVEQAARRGDDHIRTAINLAGLFLERNATDQQCHGQLVVFA